MGMELFEKSSLRQNKGSAIAADCFEKFCSADCLDSILIHFRHLCKSIGSQPTYFPLFISHLKKSLLSLDNQNFLKRFENKTQGDIYRNGTACQSLNVLVVGGGPCGLRTSIEAQLLGARVRLVEKRRSFSRHNVLHLWPFVIADLKSLGAKTFYHKFCAGSIDHISISSLECLLLKIALLLGVDVFEGVEFVGVQEPEEEGSGWRVMLKEEHPLSLVELDVIVGASGHGAVLDGFDRKELRAKLAIAITANFVNRRTAAEVKVEEISGVSFIFLQEKFQRLAEMKGIDLENFVYYKDETHYFVMTVKKQSLLWKGVLMENMSDTKQLLDPHNVHMASLLQFVHEAVDYWTDCRLPNLEFALNHRNEPDVALFDFTAIYQAENACQVLERHKKRLLITLVGDSLLEPFWPTGTGISRGFLSCLDACWIIRSWALKVQSPLEMLAERESIYRLLGQTTVDNLKKMHSFYTVDPATRYLNLNLSLVSPSQVQSLYKTDVPPHDLRQIYPNADEEHISFIKTEDDWSVDEGSPLWNSTCLYETTSYTDDPLQHVEQSPEMQRSERFSRLFRSITIPMSSSSSPFSTLRHKTSVRTNRVKGFVERLEDAKDLSADSSVVVETPYMQELKDLRQSRDEFAMERKMEALARIRELHERRGVTRQIRKGRSICRLESVKLPTSFSSGTLDTNYSSRKNDDFFDEYKMRLYRKTVPTIGERSQNLEKKLYTKITVKTNPSVLGLKDERSESAIGTQEEKTCTDDNSDQLKRLNLIDHSSASKSTLSLEESPIPNSNDIEESVEDEEEAWKTLSRDMEIERLREERMRLRMEDEAEMKNAEKILEELDPDAIFDILNWTEENL